MHTIIKEVVVHITQIGDIDSVIASSTLYAPSRRLSESITYSQPNQYLCAWVKLLAYIKKQVPTHVP